MVYREQRRRRVFQFLDGHESIEIRASAPAEAPIPCFGVDILDGTRVLAGLRVDVGWVLLFVVQQARWAFPRVVVVEKLVVVVGAGMVTQMGVVLGWMVEWRDVLRGAEREGREIGGVFRERVIVEINVAGRVLVVLEKDRRAVVVVMVHEDDESPFCGG